MLLILTQYLYSTYVYSMNGDSLTDIKKYEHIIDNKINGNFTDFKRLVGKLNKVGLLRLIDVWVNEYRVDINEVIRQLNLVIG